MPEPIHVLAMCGSLRRVSLNRALLRATVEEAPHGIRIAPSASLGGLPLYDQDLEADLPPEVASLRSAVRDADALLLVGPEYNHSVSGVMKNAIDWLSRPPQRSPLRAKPVALMGASTSFTGTARGQQHMLQIADACGMAVLPREQLLVTRDAFDAVGELKAGAVRQQIRAHLAAFAVWIAHVGNRETCHA